MNDLCSTDELGGIPWEGTVISEKLATIGYGCMAFLAVATCIYIYINYTCSISSNRENSYI